MSAADDRDIVVLVHGLARTPRMFWRMAPALEGAGFETIRYGYHSIRYSAGASAAMFRGYLEHLAETDAQGRTVHLVGFSLGALLIRAALDRRIEGLKVGRVVMIGPPNKGAGILNDMVAQAWARRFMGPAIQDVREGSDWLEQLGTPKHEIGVIAGTKAYPGVSMASHMNFLKGAHTDEPSDGTVEVRNTLLDGMSDFATVHASHTFLCQNADSIRQTVYFLEHGKFLKTAAERNPLPLEEGME
jgi:pimeloyl-ACP methyl ester carboxylesterase